MAEHGSFVWNELATSDVEGAKTFFGELLGWSFRDMNMGGQGTYTVIQSGDKDAGGMMSLANIDAPGVPPHWMSYIAVDDVDARAGKVAALGGKVIREPFDIPNVGRMSVIADPSGAVVCLMTMAQQDG